MSAECSAENIPPVYKQTEVGEIPKDWDVCLLDSVANRGSGHTPDKAHPEYWGGNIKWISLQDSDRLDKLYIYDTAAKITPLGIKNSSAKMHLEGTVVLSRDAGVGKSAIMKEDMAVSQHFMAWKCGSLLNNHFLYYWLQSNKSEFERIAMGNTIKTIGLPYFRRLSIPLPTVAEQESIAEALSDTDALIESLEQLIAKKRQIKQGAMQELLTGKRRLPEFEIKKGYKHTEAGVIPEDWEVRQIGEICKVNQGLQIAISNRLKIPSPNSKKYITIQYLNEGKEAEYIDTYSQTVCCNLNDVLMTRTGNTGIVITDVEGVFHNNFFKINFDRRIITKEHIVNFLRLEQTQRQILIKAGTSTIPDLNHNDFYSIYIVVPPLAEQTAIDTILSDMDSEITALEEKLAKARQIKQGMMQELLTGRIRLI